MATNDFQGPLSQRIRTLERQVDDMRRTIEQMQWQVINRPGYGFPDDDDDSGFKGGSAHHSPQLRISRKLRVAKK